MTTTPTGQIIDGRYEVRRSLGAGSFGEVYEVFDHNLQQISALKLLRRTPWGTWAEAQVLASLHGEYILPVRNASTAAGQAYIVTELATHGTVADKVPAGIGIPIPTAVRWARQACSGVSRIHDSGLLHCDIKPENLFLSDSMDVLVGDLGLCQRQDHNGLAHAAGSIPTMAPEVARTWTLGPGASTLTYSVQSDVYSLGASLFWMIAGEPAVPGANSFQDVWTAPQPDIWDRAPHVSNGLRNIINGAIARNPSARYRSVSDFDAALGGRTLPGRVWTRVAPHAGHRQCFVGEKGASRVEVCAIPTGKGRQLEIVARRGPTRRLIRNVTRRVSEAGLAAGLRGAIRKCS